MVASALGVVPRPSATAGTRAGRWWRRHPDWCAVVVLVSIPLAAFVVPACLGHPAIAGDNAIQNFPLRVLSGRQLRAGQLPLWNPLIWSGSPLLGGLNAGALYPMTLVFVVLPAIGAWVLNLLVVYWAAGLGLYALARQVGLRPLPALLGALAYACSGAMVGQMVHLPIIQGLAWVPLIVLAELRLAGAVLGVGRVPGRLALAMAAAGGAGPAVPAAVPADGTAAPAVLAAVPADGTAAPAVLAAVPADRTVGASRPRALPWLLLLAVLVGLVFLAGEPRGMAEVEIVAPVVALWTACRRYRGPGVPWAARLRYLGLVVVAGCWAVVIGAGQLLPGWHFITASQRASETYSYFGSGSLRPAWSALLAVPDLFGGNGVAHQPVYFNHYNLPEVTGYMGLLPLVALCVLVAGAVGRRRWPAGTADALFWCALAALGLLLAWGSFTPIGHLFWHIPLFGKARLQSRNLGIVDLGLAMALAYWADRALRPGPEGAGGTGTGWRRLVALTPVVVAVALCASALVAPGAVEQAFGVAGQAAAQGRRMAPWLAAELAVAVGVGAVVLGWRRWRPTTRRLVLSIVFAVDLLLFGVTCATGFGAGRDAVEPNRSLATSVLGVDGRFAMYDTTANHLALLTALGQPDLNTFTELPSVQGYGSLVAQRYGDATGTHNLDSLDACALARGTFVPLRLSSLVTVPTFLVRQVFPPTHLHLAAPVCPGAPQAGTATQRTWYFGQVTHVVQLALRPTPPPAGASALDAVVPTVGVLGPAGAVSWPEETVSAAPGGGWTVRLAAPSAGVGIVVRGAAGAMADTSTVTTRSGVRYELDGYLQDALGQQSWRFVRLWRGGAVFRTTSVRPPVWIQGRAGAGSVRVQATSWDQEVDRVHAARAVTVVRSESSLAGWRASAVPVGGGPTRTLAVRAVGLVQGVRVPAGSWVLTFSYHPSGLRLGLVGSVVGVLAAIVVGLALAVLALRRRRDRSVQRRSAPPRSPAAPMVGR